MKTWNADEIMSKFDTVSTSSTGYQTFIGISDSAASEWGVDVVVLSEQANGNHTIAYRQSNPMNDEAWKVGDLDDVADALSQQEDNWRTFDNPEYEVE